LCDALETAPDSSVADYDGDGTGDVTLLDDDGDGVPNFRDLDSDNDSIADAYESGTNCADANGDGVCDGDDPDRDGIPSSLDTTATSGTVGAPRPVDTDGDGALDYRDLDSDGDGIFDIHESTHFSLDADLDGMIDATADKD